MTLLEFLQKGGPVNWILAGLMFISLVIIVERILYFLQTGYTRKKMLSDPERIPPRSLPGRLKRVWQCWDGQGKEEKKMHLEKEGALLAEEMEQGLWLLSFIVACAPSLGLLGTVSGLVKAFQQIAASGAHVEMQALSVGIWEAMLTTACGLIVAIPALFFYRLFRRITVRRSLDLSLIIALCEERDRTEDEPSVERNAVVGYA